MLTALASMVLAACGSKSSGTTDTVAGTTVGHYAVSADGLTVTDTSTGLVWQRDGSGARPGCIGDPYCSWFEAQDYCRGLTLDGMGWRLPALTDLQSIVDKTVASPPTIHQKAFPNTVPDAYWTSSQPTDMGPGSSNFAYVVDFTSGDSDVRGLGGGENYGKYVRCVRDPAPAQTGNGGKLVAKTIALGYAHSCALLVDGTLWCWGANSEGQLGDGTQTARSIPIQVPDVTAASGLAAGRGHTCVILDGGSVLCWGSNAAGELGNGTSYTAHAERAPVTGISSSVSIVSGPDTICGLLADASVWCWGAGDFGELGNGTSQIDSRVPVQVSDIGNVTHISAGGELAAGPSGPARACAVLADGSVWCWGSAQTQDVVTPANSSKVPVQSPGIDNAVMVASGPDHTCALLVDGTVYCWGVAKLGNGAGVLGSGTEFGSPTPVKVSGIEGAIDISASARHTCVVLSDHTVWCWGSGTHGELGNGMTQSTTIPVRVVNITDATAVVAGDGRTCVVLATGTVQCFGSNDRGVLGNGSTADSSIPVTVSGF
jgi:alpha-tubulin suppressor-like RCC1 family protein